MEGETGETGEERAIVTEGETIATETATAAETEEGKGHLTYII